MLVTVAGSFIAVLQLMMRQILPLLCLHQHVGHFSFMAALLVSIALYWGYCFHWYHRAIWSIR